MFTRVLKGHIAVSKRSFPAGTPGCLLDSFARASLWEIGKNFNHGVGHGVGAALNVHEGPQRISPVLDNHPLVPGMIISNEPGYYEDGNFGIRIENLLIVKENEELGSGNWLKFEPLTMIPIQKKLINFSLLGREDTEWLNEYHAQVWSKVSPLVAERSEVLNWLRTATNPILIN